MKYEFELRSQDVDLPLYLAFDGLILKGDLYIPPPKN